VLIHGAWQGSWAFEAWLPALREHGFRAHAVDLPGNGWPPAPQAPASLEAYTAHVVNVLRSLDEPAVLVGHSGGGITASQVAEMTPERVAALVYLAGIMLPSGVGFDRIIELCEQDAPGTRFDGIAPYLDRSADGSGTRVRIEGALRCFVQDCEPVAALRAAGLLREQQDSGRRMKPLLSSSRYGSVPRIYVECTEDRSLLLPLQRKMQALTPGAVCLRMDCGHVPQLAQPATLAERLRGSLEDLMAGKAQNRTP
jgi:pimeloyl-ACP methyl ester carboxylesterase